MEGLDGGEPSWVGFLGVLWAQAHLIHAPWNTGAPAVPSKFTFSLESPTHQLMEIYWSRPSLRGFS